MLNPDEDDWTIGAACAGVLNDKIWFPVKGENHAFAESEKICLSCPILERCRVESIEERHGNWAASTPRMRAAARSRLRAA